MIDESLRQHYRRLFSVKPTIDTGRTKSQTNKGPRRPQSANVNSNFNNRKSLKTSRQFASNEQVNSIFENRLNSQFHNDDYCTDGVLRPTSKRVNVNNSEYDQFRNISSNNHFSNQTAIMKVQSQSQISVSDKIDDFFAELSKQEMQRKLEEEQKQMQIMARRNYLSQRSVSYQSSFDSRPSTAKISFQSGRKTYKSGGKSDPNLNQKKSSSLSPAEPRVKLSLRPSSANVPKKKDINFVQQNIKKTGIIRQRCGVTPRIDPGVESRLRYNRNYQAPRKKKTIMIKEPEEPDFFPDEKQDYEADFESDEYGDEMNEGEEPRDEATQHREAWLVEQAERGRARQRALMIRIEAGEKKNSEERLSREDPGQRVIPEKESSRDSAYGYSADSRIPTREPTPDYRMMASNNRRILVNLKSKRDSKLQKSKSDEDIKRQNAEYNKKKSHLKFLSDVTSDIITRGIYSERGLRSAINSQVKKEEYDLSSLDIENLLRQLKLELGIEQDVQQKTKTRTKNVSRDTFLSDLLNPGPCKVNPASGKPLYPPAPPHRKTLQEIKEFSKRPHENVEKVFDDLDESQIRDILKDASFDSETVTSIIGGLMSKENRCDGGKEETKSLESPKLFNDFNISSFNISFNAGKQTRELDTVQKSSKKKDSVLQRLSNRHDSSSTDNGLQSRPKGVKDKIVPKKVKNNSEESSATNIKRESAIVFSSPTPRSSSLYHPESDEEKTIGDNADKEESDVDRTYSVEEDVEDDKDGKEVEPDYSSDNASEIAEELDD